MKTTTIRNRQFSSTHDTQSDTLQDDFDDLVRQASQGDPRAIGAIAVALGPVILAEARLVLGPFWQEDEDVLQDFLQFLLEGGSRFTPAHGRALVWMGNIVRAIALRRRRERERDWGLAPEEE